MIERGIATFTLDTGKCPAWLFRNMVKLGRAIIFTIVKEYGPKEFIKRISDPIWFQSLGTLLAFDWNASGLTTTLTAALKEAIRNEQKNLNIFICGGKGKTSLKTPEEIYQGTSLLSLPQWQADNLVYNSRMSAKIDNSLLQDGYQIYHHCFFFSKDGTWAVVQQGMNTKNQTARRYHWYSEKITDIVTEPHSGIIGDNRLLACLDLTAQDSQKNRQISLEILDNFSTLVKDIQIINRYYSSQSRVFSFRVKERKYTFLRLTDKDYFWHPVVEEDFFSSKYLFKILAKLCEIKPASYEKLVSTEGVGPKTIRALSLVAELIYGAKPSYVDPCRYSFAFGGKDKVPYPIQRETYQTVINFFQQIVPKTELSVLEKDKLLFKLKSFR